MNNNGGSGSVGGSTQWRVKQRAFCFTVVSSVVRHFGFVQSQCFPSYFHLGSSSLVHFFPLV